MQLAYNYNNQPDDTAQCGLRVRHAHTTDIAEYRTRAWVPSTVWVRDLDGLTVIFNERARVGISCHYQQNGAAFVSNKAQVAMHHASPSSRNCAHNQFLLFWVRRVEMSAVLD
jgi:hypothetical protein